jgi:hypothetical protein
VIASKALGRFARLLSSLLKEKYKHCSVLICSKFLAFRDELRAARAAIAIGGTEGQNKESFNRRSRIYKELQRQDRGKKLQAVALL